MHAKVIIADEFPLNLKGLKTILRMQLALTEVTEVTTNRALMMELVKGDFTHLIMDIILSDGSTLELLPNIHEVYPELRVMLFSRNPIEVYEKALKQYGIYFCLHQGRPEEEIGLYIRQFIKNEQPARVSTSHQQNNPFTVLAPREFEIFQLVVEGLRSKAISEILNLKINTVSTVKKRIYEKTFTNNDKELMDLAALYKGSI
jgi:two-component system invasion response regulator UvrY